MWIIIYHYIACMDSFLVTHKAVLKYISFSHTAAQAPVQPTSVTVVNVSSSSAIIQWTVALISYTPEQYMVQFGLRENMLNETSTTVNGNWNVSVMNETHTLVINDLHSGTTYYFRVISRNTFGSAQSNLVTLTTLQGMNGFRCIGAGMKFISILFHVAVYSSLHQDISALAW